MKLETKQPSGAFLHNGVLLIVNSALRFNEEQASSPSDAEKLFATRSFDSLCGDCGKPPVNGMAQVERAGLFFSPEQDGWFPFYGGTCNDCAEGYRRLLSQNGGRNL